MKSKRKNKVRFNFALMRYRHGAKLVDIARALELTDGAVSNMARKGFMMRRYLLQLREVYGDISECVVEIEEKETAA